jgi:hypothetical protein
MPWIICAAGILFCLSGGYFFHKTVFEENGSLRWPLLIMLMGVILIAIGTAKYYRLIK